MDTLHGEIHALEIIRIAGCWCPKKGGRWVELEFCKGCMNYRGHDHASLQCAHPQAKHYVREYMGGSG